MSECKYWNEEHQECSVGNNTYEQGYEQGRADERTKVLEEVMAIVKAKLSEKEYPIATMVELTDLGARIEVFKKEQSNG